ncbi:MAG TPA: acyl carrier protein [Tepidisphaeraceae bacterium]|jgi:acyl carrier protein
MALSRDEIYSKVQGVLVDALGVDEEEVTPKARLKADLGAESIDFLDIVFRLEKAFTTDPAKKFTIPRGELFPEDLQTMQNDPSLITDGKITPKGIEELKKRLPHIDFTEFEKDPQVEKSWDLVTVDMITNYLNTKLNG